MKQPHARCYFFRRGAIDRRSIIEKPILDRLPIFFSHENVIQTRSKHGDTCHHTHRAYYMTSQHPPGGLWAAHRSFIYSFPTSDGSVTPSFERIWDHFS